VNENEVQIEVIYQHHLASIKDKIYLKQDLKLATIVAVDKLAERRYWVTGDGLAACSATKLILVTEKRCLDIRAEP
jgi:hypothetical protein